MFRGMDIHTVQAAYHIPYSGLFSRGNIFVDCLLFANIFPLKLYRCMVIYKLHINHPQKFYPQNEMHHAFAKIFPLENNPLYGISK